MWIHYIVTEYQYGFFKDDITEATTKVATLLDASVKPPAGATIPWRVDPKNFLHAVRSGSGIFPSGCVDFSSSWFQARKDASHQIFHDKVIKLILFLANCRRYYPIPHAFG